MDINAGERHKQHANSVRAAVRVRRGVPFGWALLYPVSTTGGALNADDCSRCIKGYYGPRDASVEAFAPVEAPLMESNEISGKFVRSARDAA